MPTLLHGPRVRGGSHDGGWIRARAVPPLVAAVLLFSFGIGVPGSQAHETGPAGSGASSGHGSAIVPAAGALAAVTSDARIVHEAQVSSSRGAGTVLHEGASEPVIATHPTDPRRLAAVHLRFSRAGSCSADPVLRISHDAGQTWVDARARPWAGSGRCPGIHAAIAWGPGPHEGSARLYWVDTVYDGGGLRVATAWSDDEGRTWSRIRVERRTPPWVGGFPDITVDRDPASPNRGAVYVAYNWSGDARRGPGIRLLASSDYGRTWRSVEIAPVPGQAGFGEAWRINCRVRTGPDGLAYVAFFQADLHAWNSRDIFSRGPWGNVGRVGFAVARVAFDRATGRLTARPAVMATTLSVNAWTAYSAATPGTTGIFVDPTWSLSLDVDLVAGRVHLAVGSYRASSRSSTPRGTVRVRRSDDRGETWRWTTLPALPAVAGRLQSSFRPSLTASGGIVVVGLRGISDVPSGTRPGGWIPTIGAAYAVSVDGGRTFGAPRPISSARWSAASLASATNGPGLRDRSDRLADGRVFYAYGDGRLARPAPDPRAGRAAVFGALIEVKNAETAYGASGPNAGRRSPRIGASDAANVAVRWWSSR